MRLKNATKPPEIGTLLLYAGAAGLALPDAKKVYRGLVWRCHMYGIFTVEFCPYVVEKKTPSGYWLRRPEWFHLWPTGLPDRTWRSREGHFVSATKLEALRCLVYRKHSHVQHELQRLSFAKEELLATQGLLAKLGFKEVED